MFENLLLIYECWPRNVKHVEFTEAVDMSIHRSWCIFLRCYLRSYTSIFRVCRVS